MLRRNGLVAFAGAALAMTLVSTAAAQRPGGPGGPGGFGAGRGAGSTALLANEQVQKELGLSEDQIARLQEIGRGAAEGLRGAFEGLRDASPEERQARMEELRKQAEARRQETEQKIASILNPQQVNRLKQIQRQLRGVSALVDDEVAQILGLSTEQKERLQAIVAEGQSRLREGLQTGGRPQGADRGSFRERIQAIQNEQQKKAMEVLTAAQQDKLSEVFGEKFELQRTQTDGPRRGTREGTPGTRRPGAAPDA